MAVISSYTTLNTAVGDYLARSDLTSYIPNFIQNFEERFYRDPANWASWMESALSVTLSNNVAALPSNYLGLRIAYFSGYRELDRLTLEQLYARYPRGGGTSGVAKFIARNVNNLEFGPESQSGTLLGTYYAKPTVLRSYTTGGADAIAHFLIVNAPDLLLYGALLEAEPFLKNDDRIPVWQGFLDRARDVYQSRFVEEELSGSTPYTVAM